MNRIYKAWKSLGRARQVALLVLGAVSLLQAVLLIVVGQSWLLPQLAVVVLVGFVVIKQSAAARDAVTHLTREAKTRKAEQPVGTATVVRTDSGPALGLLREQVGRTVGQFTWLGERTLETAEHIDVLQANVNDALAAIASQQERIVALETGLAANSERVSETMAAGDEKLVATVLDTRDHLSSTIAAIDERLTHAFDGGNSHSLERRLVAELSALALLHESASGPDLPPFEGWAMSPLTARLMRSLACKLGPDSTIVELGSGVSTAWTAHALSQRADPAKYIAIDHSPAYAAQTERQVEQVGGAAVVDIVVAPLQAADVGGESFTWYGQDWLEGVSNIALLVVDGPPAGKDAGARYPALPLLVNRLADEATIIVDDADRPGESEAVSRWLSIPGLAMIGSVGRSAVLSYSRPGRAGE